MSGTHHVYPLGDIVVHDTTSTCCVCGPTVEHHPGPHGDGWLVIHHSLDGRERRETTTVTLGRRWDSLACIAGHIRRRSWNDLAAHFRRRRTPRG